MTHAQIVNLMRDLIPTPARQVRIAPIARVTWETRTGTTTTDLTFWIDLGDVSPVKAQASQTMHDRAAAVNVSTFIGRPAIVGFDQGSPVVLDLVGSTTH